MFRSKNYKESSKLIDKSALYDPKDALQLVCDASKAKFDETVGSMLSSVLTVVMQTSRSAALSFSPTAQARPSAFLFSASPKR